MLSDDQFVDVLQRSGLAARRPVDQTSTITGMLRRASSIVTARVDGKLIGVARTISDFAYCSYLSDLAVDCDWQKQGIGKQLILLAHQHCGLHTRLILLAAPAATEYYPHIGFEKHNSCWTIAPQEPTLHNADSQAAHTPIKPQSNLNSLQPEQLERFFDSIAAEYDEAIHRCFPRYPEMLDMLIDFSPPSLQPKRIVDLGCGSGNLAERIVARYPSAELHLVDLSAELLNVAERRLSGKANCHFYPQNMLDVNFEAGSVDLIYSSIAVHHLTPEEKQVLFTRCQSWLSDDGAMLMADQCAGATATLVEQHHAYWQKLSKCAGASEEEWQAWQQHERQHDYHETASELQRKFSKAGIETTDIVWRYLLWTIVIAQ